MTVLIKWILPLFLFGAFLRTDKSTEREPLAMVSENPPDENRFTIEVLDQKINEPMQLAVTPDGKVIYIERQGFVKQYNPATKTIKQIGKLNANFSNEDGLLGLALDPKFKQNNWIYFFYSLAGKDSVQRISRFTLIKGQIALATEKVLLQIPVIRACCHSGGSVEFGPDGNLYISTGDNTNPFASDGYAPIDEREGRKSWDAQKSSSNPNDLRGKILRIRPNDDGSYSIPGGNLFPKGTPNTRPEIYVMGNRNPFRISIDQKTNYLYWGEVGPDAGTDSALRGPKGHDEINQARKAGFFGWPYFVGNNKPYYDFDFITQKSGVIFDPAKPVNNSPNNTGIKELPPAQPAFIWYPYSESDEFPVVGKGGRNAMAGPVYYEESFPDAVNRFPSYYQGKLFIYDWMRNWIIVVTMDREGGFQKMEPFLPSTGFIKPVDMQFGPDGALYILEYGSFWRSHNDDSRLIRIEYNEGNRKPVAKIMASNTKGALPFTVHFSAEGSFDYDEDDALSYSWMFEGTTIQSENRSDNYTFKKPGVYKVKLLVKDKSGETGTASLNIQVGNEPPKVFIETMENRSFYWDNQPLQYKIRVTDKEDGSIMPSAVRVAFDYLPQGNDLVQTALANTSEALNPYLKGKSIMDKSDCKACHAITQTSVGPSYTRIANRYKGKNVVSTLAQRIIKGGSGNWGEVAMSAHPQLSKEDAEQIVRYILNINAPKKMRSSLPQNGKLITNKHKGTEGSYFLSAVYTDEGAKGIKPITTRESIRLRHPVMQALSCDSGKGVMMAQLDRKARFTEDGSYIVFKQIDLKNIKGVTYKIWSGKVDGTLEFHLDGPQGKIISSLFVEAKAAWNDYKTLIESTNEVHDLYFVFRSTNHNLDIWSPFDISTIEFRK